MISRSAVVAHLRSFDIPEELREQILKGWNDNSAQHICEMLTTLGVKRSFVVQNKDKYFSSNVYDTVKPRLEKHLLDAQRRENTIEVKGLTALVAIFEQQRDELKGVTEYRTIIRHMDRCGKHE